MLVSAFEKRDRLLLALQSVWHNISNKQHWNF